MSRRVRLNSIMLRFPIIHIVRVNMKPLFPLYLMSCTLYMGNMVKCLNKKNMYEMFVTQKITVKHMTYTYIHTMILLFHGIP